MGGKRKVVPEKHMLSPGPEDSERIEFVSDNWHTVGNV